MYLQRGGADGGDFEDWLRAEQELTRPSDQRSSSTASRDERGE
jgi:hypothetical protein